jgi:hypothetical protein
MLKTQKTSWAGVEVILDRSDRLERPMSIGTKPEGDNNIHTMMGSTHEARGGLP